MSRPPSLTSLLAFSLLTASALGLAAPRMAHADDACATKKFNYPAVAKACKDGGRKAAKDLMKGAVKKAKAAGKDVKCTSCHEDAKEFKLKSNAVDDLKPWI